MKTILIIITIFVSLNSFGQQIKTDSAKIGELKNDIKEENLVLNCGGTFEVFAYSKENKFFEKKYGLKYKIFDCLVPEYDKIVANNIKVVQYLDKKFGIEWRAFARQDIIGIKIK